MVMLLCYYCLPGDLATSLTIKNHVHSKCISADSRLVVALRRQGWNGEVQEVEITNGHEETVEVRDVFLVLVVEMISECMQLQSFVKL